MTFDDIYNGVNDVYVLTPLVKTYEDAMNALDEIKYNEDLSEAEKIRRALEYVGKDIDLRDIFSKNEDIMKELRTQITSEYNDEDIIKALKLGGEGKKANLYSYKDGWMSIPTKDFVLMAKNAGINPKELIQYLGDKQRVHDRENVVEGIDPVTGERNMKDWLQSAYMGIMAPRQKEALKRGEDPSATDAILDAGELIASSIPVGGPTTKIVSKIGFGKGARGLGARIGHRLTKEGKTLIDAAVVPVLTEAADAVAYDDPTNARSVFNPADAVIGTVTNASAPWLMRGGLGIFAEPVGSRAGLSKTIEELADDPSSRALYKVEEALNMLRDAKNRSNKYTADELQAARDIIASSAIVKDNPELAKYAKYITGEMFWPERPFMNPVRDKSKEVGKNYNAYLEANPSTKAKRDIQKEAVQSDLFPSESESFEAAGSNVFATDFLKDQSKWGLTKGGKVGLVNKEKAKALDLNTENKIDPRHASNSAKELRLQEAMGHETDRGYPRASAFDKEMDRLIRANPEQFKAASASGALSGLRTLTTNKLAPVFDKRLSTGYGSAVKSIERKPDEKQVKIQEYLNDPSVIRMWTEGKFKPREISGDPLWEAYKIFQKQKENK